MGVKVSERGSISEGPGPIRLRDQSIPLPRLGIVGIINSPNDGMIEQRPEITSNLIDGIDANNRKSFSADKPNFL